MPVTNIVDRRKRKYRFLKINAVIEAAWHDNGCHDADQISNDGDGPSYDQREHITLADALAWANAFTVPVTLYVYDEDDGIYARRPELVPNGCATDREP